MRVEISKTPEVVQGKQYPQGEPSLCYSKRTSRELNKDMNVSEGTEKLMKL
jgi:hypothetical protein